MDHKLPPAIRPGGLPIEVLAPNGDRLPFNPGLPVPLGSAVNIVEPLKVHDTAQLHDLTLISPWTPIAVTRPDAPGFEALLGAWRADARLTGLVALNAESITAPHAALHAALRADTPPSGVEVAVYIHSRTRSSRLHTAILGELTQDESLSRSARYERFASAGRLTANGWLDLFLLARALSHPGHVTVDAIAGAIDRCTRTLYEIPKRRLGMTFTLARTGFGWRWAIECVLRQQGYLEEEDSLSLAVGPPSARLADHAWWLHSNRKSLEG